MALKGHAKIQLFDAKTGELTDEVENDNLVTNAVKDVATSIIRDWINWPSDEGIKFSSPLYLWFLNHHTFYKLYIIMLKKYNIHHFLIYIYIE